VATLTYVYADSTAVLGPLATYAEPHCYDLCEQHAGSLTVPRGWEVLRLAMPTTPQQPGPDDLLALANAVRDAAALPPAAGHRQARAAFSPGSARRQRKVPEGATCASCGNRPERIWRYAGSCNSVRYRRQRARQGACTNAKDQS
jgi:hypothetical protein